jgi:hypothetical protein
MPREEMLEHDVRLSIVRFVQNIRNSAYCHKIIEIFDKSIVVAYDILSNMASLPHKELLLVGVTAFDHTAKDNYGGNHQTGQEGCHRAQTPAGKGEPHDLTQPQPKPDPNANPKSTVIITFIVIVTVLVSAQALPLSLQYW